MFEKYEDPLNTEKFFSRLPNTVQNSMIKDKPNKNKCCNKLYAHAKELHSKRKDKENQDL
jgi:hypothetical protein